MKVEKKPGDSENVVTLTAQELQSRLWEAANILRSSAVDRTDWKGYILPLLFFKRICDVWDEENSEATDTYGDAYSSQFPEVHRFQVPEGCHWRDIRETAVNVGTALAHAMQEIERANPDTLYRVFGTADWGNKEKFTDELLKDLIEGFSLISLGNTAVDTDILGDAYEYLVGKFADVTRRNKAGEFYTPRSVVRMMVEILDPKEGESIYDPACGTGGMLLAAIDHVKRAGGDPRTFFGKIYGQEKNLTTSSVARMNLVLHGIEDSQIAREDTLRDPVFTDGAGGLATFDCVIANPPFSLKEWGREVWENDPWGRAQHGLPPDSYGDYAFVQHMIASMAYGGSPSFAAAWPSSSRKAHSSARAPKARSAKPSRAQGRRDRSGHRPRAEPLLRYAARSGCSVVIFRRTRSLPSGRTRLRSGAHHRRLESLPKGPRFRTSSTSNTASGSSSGSKPLRMSRTAPRSSPSTRSKRKVGRSISPATSCRPSARTYLRSPRPSPRSRKHSPKLAPLKITSAPC